MANEASVVKEKAVKAPKVKSWFMESANSRDLMTLLNKLSAAGHEIFSVTHSANVGGSFEVISSIEK